MSRFRFFEPSAFTPSAFTQGCASNTFFENIPREISNSTINDVSAIIQVKNIQVCPTCTGVSFEGQALTGSCAVCDCNCALCVSYISRQNDRVCQQRFDVPFTDFVTLPCGTSLASLVTVDPRVVSANAFCPTCGGVYCSVCYNLSCCVTPPCPSGVAPTRCPCAGFNS